MKRYAFRFYLVLQSSFPRTKKADDKIYCSKRLGAAETGIQFENRLTENDSLNYFTYSYLYMGGEVFLPQEISITMD